MPPKITRESYKLHSAQLVLGLESLPPASTIGPSSRAPSLKKGVCLGPGALLKVRSAQSKKIIGLVLV